MAAVYRCGMAGVMVVLDCVGILSVSRCGLGQVRTAAFDPTQIQERIR